MRMGGVDPIRKVLPISPPRSYTTYDPHVARHLDSSQCSAQARRDAALRSHIERVFAENFIAFGTLTELERGAIRERTRAGLEAARAWGTVRGRPTKQKPADLRIAQAMLADSDSTEAEVAAHLGASTATPYRRLPAPRTNSKLD